MVLQSALEQHHHSSWARGTLLFPGGGEERAGPGRCAHPKPAPASPLVELELPVQMALSRLSVTVQASILSLPSEFDPWPRELAKGGYLGRKWEVWRLYLQVGVISYVCAKILLV